MKKTISIIKWICAGFVLLLSLAYFPSVSSILMAALGVFLMPITPIQNYIRKFLKARWLRIVVAILLFIAALSLVPTDPVEPNIAETSVTTEPSLAETVEPTTENTTETTTTTIGTTEGTTATTLPQVVLPTENSSFEVHFIDVGQADAALVLCDGKAMLIDGGNAGDSSKLYSYLKKHSISHLDYVIGTHAHEDHIGGIAGALNYATVDTAYCPVTNYTSDAFRNFAKAVENHGISLTVPTTGTTFALGSAACKILAVNTTGDTNNSSIVLRITYGNTSFLFTGDAEREAELAIIDRGETLKSTVLKVGHHGSETSTSYVWLREIMPEYAVISVGSGNSYGHPTEEVLSRLRDADVKTFRTDLQGDIICTSDGNSVTVSVTRNAGADVFGGIGGNSTQKPTEPVEIQKPTIPVETQKPTEPEEPQAPTEPDNNHQQGTHYVLNTNSEKFHHPGCHSANRISAANKQNFYGTREELIAMGYEPCGNCDP